MADSPQNPDLPWHLMAFLADAIGEECSDKQAQPTSSATLNCPAAWPPGHSWPHLARSYLQENGVGGTVICTTLAGPNRCAQNVQYAAGGSVSLNPQTPSQGYLSIRPSMRVSG